MSQDIKVAIGKKIRERRKELKLEQTYIQDYTQMSPATLSNIEQGSANFTIDKLIAIADLLGLEIELKVKETR